MKSTVQLVLAGMILAQSAFAQNPNAAPAIPLVGNSAGGTLIFGPNGQQRLDQTTQDNVKALDLVLQQTVKVQELDRAYLKGVVEELNAHLLTLAALKLKFTELSQESSYKRIIDVTEFLTLVNAINNRDQILRNEIQTKTLITRDTMPSYDPAEAAGVKITIATPGNVNMKPVMDRVDLARASMMTEMNNLPFPKIKNRFDESASITENALTPKLPAMRVLTDEERREKQKLVLKLQTLEEDTLQYSQRFGDLAITEINNFLKLFAKDEYLRFRNENDQVAAGKIYERLAEGFFRRSYLRRKYNVRLGALRTKDYPKNTANIEDFKIQPMWEVMSSFQRGLAENEPDIAVAYENVRNWVEAYDKKTTKVFASKEDILKNPKKVQEYASKNTGILVRANSAINSITGQDNAAESLLMIMRLILADTSEEMMMFSADPNALVAYHNSKYRATDEQKATYAVRACGMDAKLSANDRAFLKCARPYVAPQMSGGKSFAEIFAGLQTSIEMVEIGRRKQALDAQKLVEMDSQAAQASSAAGNGVSDMFQ